MLQYIEYFLIHTVTNSTFELPKSLENAYKIQILGMVILNFHKSNFLNCSLFCLIFSKIFTLNARAKDK